MNFPGSSETPDCAQPLPTLISKWGWQGGRVAGCGRVWQGGTISRQIQLTTVLSAIRPISSTSEPPPERPQHRRRAAGKIETPWTLPVALAALALKPLPAPTSVLHIRSETPFTQRPNTRQTRAAGQCESEQSRCPTPAQGLIMALCQLTHLNRDTCRPQESGSSDRPSDGTAGLRCGLVLPLDERR